MTTNEIAASREVAAVLQVAAPDGVTTPEHAAKLADVLINITRGHLKLDVQHSVSVSYTDHRPMARMQAIDADDAEDIADRMDAQEAVDEVRTYRRYCSPWHRTS